MAGQDVVRRQANGTPADIVPGMDPMQLGEVFAKSGWFKDSTDPAKAVVKIIAGREMGIGPMASMQGIHIIEGKPTLSANLLAAQVKRHPAYDYIPREVTNQGARIEFFQNGEPIGKSEFTMADAQKAGIANKQNFKRYPKAMMFARALSQGVRWFCPDVTAGSPAYVPEELGAEVDEGGEPLPSPELTASEDPVESPTAEVVADEDQVQRIVAAVKALGLANRDIALIFGAVGAEAQKVNRADSILKALRALTPEQADAYQAELQRREVAGDGE